MRILDLDLDFFQEDVAMMVDHDGDRLDGEDYPPWPLGEVISFLEERCLLMSKVPGFSVEHHVEVFHLLGQRIEAGLLNAPIELVHIDAHADLGMGDAGFAYLMSALAFEPITERHAILRGERLTARPGHLDLGPEALNDGNWVAFALACGWLGDLTYVYNRDRDEPEDLPPNLMADFDIKAEAVQIHAVERSELRDSVMRVGPPKPEKSDPPVPFRATRWREYQASDPFNLIFLTRSPAYTSPLADPIYQEIRTRFIDESAFDSARVS